MPFDLILGQLSCQEFFDLIRRWRGISLDLNLCFVVLQYAWFLNDLLVEVIKELISLHCCSNNLQWTSRLGPDNPLNHYPTWFKWFSPTYMTLRGAFYMPNLYVGSKFSSASLLLTSKLICVSHVCVCVWWTNFSVSKNTSRSYVRSYPFFKLPHFLGN